MPRLSDWAYRGLCAVLAIELAAGLLALGLLAAFLPPVLALEWLVHTLPAGSGRAVPWGLPLASGMLGAVSTGWLLPTAMRLPSTLWRQARTGRPQPLA